MVTVHYQHEFPYTYVEEYDDYFPILTLRITNPLQPEQSLDIDGYLDSEAKRSFFVRLYNRHSLFLVGKPGSSVYIALRDEHRTFHDTAGGALGDDPFGPPL